MTTRKNIKPKNQINDLETLVQNDREKVEIHQVPIRENARMMIWLFKRQVKKET